MQRFILTFIYVVIISYNIKAINNEFLLFATTNTDSIYNEPFIKQDKTHNDTTQLEKAVITGKLSEAVVEARTEFNGTNIIIPITVETINKNYFVKNNTTNFAKTLTAIPGIASMDIGAGFSKPIIRGLGFNRIAVVDKGIIQQNQQWGADHGLEIDQYDVDNVRIHKGPMSLLYGSDAIGGVIEIAPSNSPKENYFWGDATLIAKSNNDLVGMSFASNLKQDKWFIRARLTSQYFGDYRIPTDTITYLTWKLPIRSQRMKNTAGRENNISLSANYRNDKLDWWIHLSNIYAKNGFFPGSHGIPDIKRLEHDGSYRNIEMPYTTVNHFKAISNTSFNLYGNKLTLDLGFQQNKRRELSKFHTHYGNQTPPTIDPDVELSFILNTISANAHLSLNEDKYRSQSIGITSEFQQNRVGGYSFLLPNFRRVAAGAYWVNTFRFCSHFSILVGLRYDIGILDIEGFFDQILAEYLTKQNYTPDKVVQYAQRANNLKKIFHDFSGSIGLVYKKAYQTWRANIGKSFRYPSANELASNGIHHGAFRHEQGDINLLPEQSYQLDVGYEYSDKKFGFSATPFVSYFSNYIFLEPTGNWSILPHSGQIYRYRQAEVWLGGGEISADYTFATDWKTSLGIEYLYNLNITDGYPLPFSVPTKTTFDITYSSTTEGICQSYYFSMGADYIFAQNRIARNEETTPDALLLNFSANAFWKIGKWAFITDFQIHNILNTAYLNHLSFYRKLNAPEPGRNIQLIVKIPFG